MKKVFEFKNYREFLKHVLPVSGVERGSRNRLAEALNCQKGFISQVLGGKSHFSLEHGIQISHFLKLSEKEEEFFLLLLHMGRAGSKDLELFYHKKLERILESRKEIEERILAHSDLTQENQMTYFSSWHYAAIHMCLMIPELRTRKAISEYLGLAPSVVNKILDFLFEVNLAKEDEVQVFAGPARVHLARLSPLINKHHSHWRLRAMDSLDNQHKHDLHYSMVMSISEESAEKIRNILLHSIESVETELKKTLDKTVYSLTLDLFSLKKINL